MARRKQLKGIAKSLSRWCLSRNNDYQGYWAPGMLYSMVNGQEPKIIKLVLIEDFVAQEELDHKELRRTYIKFINKILLANKMQSHWVKHASVEYIFNIIPEERTYFFGSGDPFLCKVNIETDLGKNFYGESYYRCWIHDPNKECRRHEF